MTTFALNEDRAPLALAAFARAPRGSSILAADDFRQGCMFALGRAEALAVDVGVVPPVKSEADVVIGAAHDPFIPILSDVNPDRQRSAILYLALHARVRKAVASAVASPGPVTLSPASVVVTASGVLDVPFVGSVASAVASVLPAASLVKVDSASLAEIEALAAVIGGNAGANFSAFATVAATEKPDAAASSAAMVKRIALAAVGVAVAYGVWRVLRG